MIINIYMHKVSQKQTEIRKVVRLGGLWTIFTKERVVGLQGMIHHGEVKYMGKYGGADGK